MHKIDNIDDTMNSVHECLHRLDLNLLLLFEALARHGQVTAAAKALGLSQPAASHALSRLRQALDDPLFVRGPDGLLPTPRASALLPRLSTLLGELDQVLRGEPGFDVASSRRVFRIAAEDAFDIVVLKALITRLAAAAPKVQLVVVHPHVDRIGADLRDGRFDVYFGVLPNQPAFRGLLPDPGEQGLRALGLYREAWTCLLRRDHPRIRRAPSLAQYVREPHVVFSPTGGGPGVVDRVLAERGRSRHVAVRVASFHSAVDCVRGGALLWTGPAAVARALDPQRALRHARVPLELPEYPVQLLWHERFDRDRGHRWLRDQIVASIRVLPRVGRIMPGDEWRS